MSQIQVLNDDFAETGLSFKLQDTIRTLNSDWFNNVSPDNCVQTTMKRKLRQGDGTALNIYTVSFTNAKPEGLLGWATFPSDYPTNTTDDGIVLLYSTLPGGSAAPFNLGHTLTYEVGHWVGLYHTFQDGCEEEGDYVDDTPAEGDPSSGCPADDRDTCPDIEGYDRKQASPPSALDSDLIPCR